MKKYSKEFKDSTVQLIINNNENVKKVAKDLDIITTKISATLNLKIEEVSKQLTGWQEYTARAIT